MKKNTIIKSVDYKTDHFIRLMKTCLLFFICSTTFLFAETNYSQTTKLSINLGNASIEKILQEIEKNSEFIFFYKQDVPVHTATSINCTGETLEQILDKILVPNNMSYKINNRQVIITKNETSGTRNNSAKTITQQNPVISGVVIDSNNESLIGVSVMIKGTTIGTLTDIDGKFSISADEGATLEFSYVGYNKKSVIVGKERNIRVTLAEDVRMMEEVVVVGYGIQKKVNVIGSVAQIGSEKLENRTVPLLSNALAGQMTGVTVIQRSGKPGDSPGEIRVRGVGSIEATPDALVLVDGAPGSINDVKPEDVQSISVLKDAATAAIYGARAANGVILITTKTGTEGKVKVSYNGYAGFTKPTALPDMVDSWEYATLYNEAVGSQSYSAEAIQKYKDGSDRDNYPNSNFLKDIFSRNGFQTGHDISISGGAKTTQYYLTLGYLDQNGIIEKNEYSRFDVRLNLSTELASNLKLSTWLAGYSSQRDEPAIPGGKDVSGMGGMVLNAVRYPAVFAGQLSNGDYGTGPEQNGTPIAWLNSSSFWENPVFKVTTRMRLDYTPLKELQLSAIVGYNHLGEGSKLFRSTMRLNDTRTMGPSFLEQEEKKTIYQTAQFLADYNKTIGKHDFSALIGYSFEEESYRNLKASRDKFPVNDLPYMDVGSADNQKSSGAGNDWAIQSVFGRFKYSYQQKYLAEATVRYDGSSRFPESKKYATFPSVALGWRISEEAFFKENVSFIHNLKLKTSWGKLGNQNIGNYPYQNTYKLDAGYVIGGQISQGGQISSLKDPNLHWEETRTTDGGIEIGFFQNGLLDINVNYFYRKTQDLLYKPSANVSKVLGLTVDYANTGSLENKGWEFELSHRNKIGDFSYNIGGNLSIIQNKLLDLGLGNVTQKNGMIGNGSDLFVGYPLQAYYGYKTDGMFIDQADIDAWYDQSAVFSKPKPGDLRYQDISGENGADGKVDPNYDKVYLGSRIPKYTFSFNLGAEYKGIDISAQFYGVAEVKGRLESYAGYALFGEGNIQRWQAEGRWDPANPQRYNEYPRLEVLAQTGSANTVLSDFWIIDASYVRLKNVQLGYTLPQKWMQKLKISSIRVYTNMENPYCWNSYRKGWDPEVNTGGDYYPLLSTYTFGLNLRF